MSKMQPSAPVTVPSAVRHRPATRQEYVDLLSAIHANGRAVTAILEAIGAAERRAGAKVDRLEAKLRWRLERTETTLADIARALGVDPPE